MKPVVIDLCCGLGGWTKGFLAEGWDAVGFDIERHRYPARAIDGSSVKAGGIDFARHDSFNGTTEKRLRDAPLTGGWTEYPAQLVLQDIRTLDGRQFRGHAEVIVASPPCQKYSYMAMPFGRSKELARWYREVPTRQVELNELVNACKRIAREAELPLIMENVKGAQPWIGRAAWHFGSYYLWGDLPALMPSARTVLKNSGGSWFGQRDGEMLERNDPRDLRRNENGEWENAAAVGGWNHPGKQFDGKKVPGIKLSEVGFNAAAAQRYFDNGIAKLSSRSDSRKAASAMIAEIPFDLSQWIARCFKP